MSDMLDERLKWLQKQLDESQKSCDRLRGEVLAFTTAAREVRTSPNRTLWKRPRAVRKTCESRSHVYSWLLDSHESRIPGEKPLQRVGLL